MRYNDFTTIRDIKSTPCLKPLAIVAAAFALVACSSAEHTDIDSWMRDKEKTLKGKIEPLPAVKNFQAVSFTTTIDPFAKKEALNLLALEKDKYAPDPNRPKEALEAYPLTNLKMVGSLVKNQKRYAIIVSPDKMVHYAAVGDYMGSNYGKIERITEYEVVLDERLQDSEQWIQKETVLELHEETTPKKK